MKMESPDDVAAAWFSRYAAAVTSGEVDTTVSTFIPDAWLRDVLVFTWDSRSLEGTEKISNYLSDALHKADITNMKLDYREHLKPRRFTIGLAYSGVEAAFTFETPIALGRGFARLLWDEPSKEWKAWSVSMMMDQLKGYEEGPEEGLYGGHTIPFGDLQAQRQAQIESEPYVLIVGAGQAGLQMAARLKSLNVPTLVIDRDARVGDTWRRRYPTLSIQTPRTHTSLAYQSYPENWPRYTPRDKMAAWLEQYAVSQDLVVWLNTSLLPTPQYNREKKKWDVDVNRNGSIARLNPSHLVLAIGTTVEPFTPVPTVAFEGEAIHGCSYMGGDPYTGKRVIVVGAANTGHDICQDLITHGAAAVTMVQRSSTFVVSKETMQESTYRVWPEGVPIEIGDFKFSSVPVGLMKKLSMAEQEVGKVKDAELHRGLLEAGFKLNYQGLQALIAERFGGHWIDFGCAKLIADGQVKIKQGVEVKGFSGKNVIFTDDSQIEVDVVIFATGYLSVRESLKKLFDSEVVERTKESWGLDAEGELKGCFRPSGQPGLWYAGGGFLHARYWSKQLALRLKALHVGILADD